MIIVGLEPANPIVGSEIYIHVVGEDLNNPVTSHFANLALGYDETTGLPNGTNKFWVQPRCIRADGTIERRDSEPPEAVPRPAEGQTTVEYLWYFSEFPDSDALTICIDCIAEMSEIVLKCEEKFA